MHLQIQKAEAKLSLQAALLRMLLVLREESGSHIDGVACDLSLGEYGPCHGNLAGLSGNLEVQGELL